MTPGQFAIVGLASAAPTATDISTMREAGLIEPRYTEAGALAGWQLTERGQAWVNAALRTPLPERRWTVRTPPAAVVEYADEYDAYFTRCEAALRPPLPYNEWLEKRND